MFAHVVTACSTENLCATVTAADNDWAGISIYTPECAEKLKKLVSKYFQKTL